MTKHSQRTDWHSGVDYRVWGDENIYPDPPNFHLSGKWQFGLCPHSELDVTRDQCTGPSSGSGIIFLLRSGKEMRRGGCHDIQCQDWSQAPDLSWGQMPVSSLLTDKADHNIALTLCLPRPVTGSIFVEKTFAELRELGAGWDHQEVMGSRGVRG